MPARERYPHLPKTVEYAHIGWDFFILAAVIINLSLLLFDSLFLIGPINDTIASLTPGFHAFYDTVIHSRFITIDLFFVGIFIADVLLGWTVAIAER
ncbi:MAG: ion transporter, partial [Vreelandella alkaliphila]